MRVLVACEESQAVTAELRRLGHEAYSCDIEPCSGGHPEWHIQQDALPLLNGWCGFITTDGKPHFVYSKWDMLIAFPPCTYLSNAGARHLYKGGQLNNERYKKGIEAKAFFMRFYNADCGKIAIENPISSRIYEMPKYTQEIQPFQFGHPVKKTTRLWIKGLPMLQPTAVVEAVKTHCPSSCSKFAGTGKNGGTKHTAKERAKTFKGIATAMAEQWAGGANGG